MKRKKIIKRLRKFMKNTLGIQIYPVKKTSEKEKPPLKMIYVHDPATSYMINPTYTEKLILELSQIAENFLSQNYFPDSSETTSVDIVREFFELYSTRKKIDNTHGSGFHNAFWLYLIARVLDPKLIVESGVWKGHTSWLLKQACPNADQYGFDINLNFVEYKNIKVKMHKQDWQTFNFPAFDPERSLVFFDCHVNNAQRIIEAKSKGFKHILFDDDTPAHKIFTHIPGIPTASMLVSDEGIDSSEISWVWNGEKKSRPIDPEEARQAKKLIKIHHPLPDVGGPTRYGGFAFLSYVQI